MYVKGISKGGKHQNNFWKCCVEDFKSSMIVRIYKIQFGNQFLL